MSARSIWADPGQTRRQKPARVHSCQRTEPPKETRALHLHGVAHHDVAQHRAGQHLHPTSTAPAPTAAAPRRHRITCRGTEHRRTGSIPVPPLDQPAKPPVSSLSQATYCKQPSFDQAAGEGAVPSSLYAVPRCQVRTRGRTSNATRGLSRTRSRCCRGRSCVRHTRHVLITV